ncbi:nuclear transport factor 2 family protein [Aurantiacibacter poecillastricola]|uniref:nuclear transport factor 2 family protein n=1 Tax=Aurantiacibacter poecillastricola TaxID=3064385 RepID=UPI00273D4FDA|nr:nuclear transport factor 2 family protein [Aurantiacibacter sp. 219JJ12-13]MDP5263257.1 nuclear transport factor 2 family protein [Aurantiacibacter sp. 219JJ12-13]
MATMADKELLDLNAELALVLADYWHEIDTNGGRNASDYYMPDAEFHGPFASYHGVKKIQQFYDWRRERGARLSIHSFTNFRAHFTGDDTAETTCFMFLYAADGEKVLPTHPPITMSLLTDRYVRRDGRWLCTFRRFEHWFEGDTPVTNPDLDEE